MGFIFRGLGKFLMIIPGLEGLGKLFYRLGNIRFKKKEKTEYEE